MKLINYEDPRGGQHVFKVYITDEELSTIELNDTAQEAWEFVTTDDFSVPVTVRLALLMWFVGKIDGYTQLDMPPKV